MSLVEIAAVVVSLLMLLSRFVGFSKPWWSWCPKLVAILLPPVVFLLPQLVALAHHSKSLGDLVVHGIVAAVLFIVGWFANGDTPATPTTPMK